MADFAAPATAVPDHSNPVATLPLSSGGEGVVITRPGGTAETPISRSADFPVCRLADNPAGGASESSRRLESSGIRRLERRPFWRSGVLAERRPCLRALENGAIAHWKWYYNLEEVAEQSPRLHRLRCYPG